MNTPISSSPTSIPVSSSTPSNADQYQSPRKRGRSLQTLVAVGVFLVVLVGGVVAMRLVSTSQETRQRADVLEPPIGCTYNINCPATQVCHNPTGEIGKGICVPGSGGGNPSTCVTPKQGNDQCCQNSDCAAGSYCQGTVGSRQCQTPQSGICQGGTCTGWIGYQCTSLTNNQCRSNPGPITTEGAAANYADGCGQIDQVCQGGSNPGTLCGGFTISNSSCSGGGGGGQCPGQCVAPTGSNDANTCGAKGLQPGSGSCTSGNVCCVPINPPPVTSQGAYVYCQDPGGPVYPMPGVVVYIGGVDASNTNPHGVYSATQTTDANGQTMFKNMNAGQFINYYTHLGRGGQPITGNAGACTGYCTTANNCSTHGGEQESGTCSTAGQSCCVWEPALNPSLTLPTGQSYANLSISSDLKSFLPGCTNPHNWFGYPSFGPQFCDYGARTLSTAPYPEYTVGISQYGGGQYGFVFHFTNCAASVASPTPTPTPTATPTPSPSPSPSSTPIACGQPCDTAKTPTSCQAGYVCAVIPQTGQDVTLKGARCVLPQCTNLGPGCSVDGCSYTPPSPTPPPSFPPPVLVGPVCLNIAANGPLTAGSSVTFTCGPVTGAAGYRFRIINPDGSISDITSTPNTSNVSQAVTLGTGSYAVQCRFCSGTDDSTCGPYESY